MAGYPRLRTTGAAPGIRRRAAGWYWLPPALLTLLTAGYGIGRAQPWRDELATWSAARRPINDLIRLVGTIDAVNGPYYLLMHGWITAFGDSVTVLRLPALGAMVGAAALTAVLGKRLFSARTGLLAGLLFAVLPSTTRYGQEVRSYALATFLAVLATLLLVEALRRPSRWRWTGYSLTVAALALAHLLALALLAGHAVAVGVTGRTDGYRRLGGFAVALAPALSLVAVPLLLLARGQQSRQLDWVDPSNLGDLAALPGAVLGNATVGGLLLGLAAVGIAGRDRWTLVLGLCVLLPAGLLFVAGLVVPLWVPRYLVYTVPFGCLLAGTVLASLRVPYALAVVTIAAGLGAPAQAGIRRTHEWPRTAGVDYRQAARIVASAQRPGDGVVYSPRDGWWFLDLGLAYHLRHGDQPRDVLAVRDQRARGDFWVSECDRPTRCLSGADRIWLLVAGDRGDPLSALPETKRAALGAYRPTESWRLSGLRVVLLVRG